MILNRQDEIPIPVAKLTRFWKRVRKELKLGRRDANVCFIPSAEMARLNRAYRNKRKTTDVLSFPYGSNGAGSRSGLRGESRNFLGDIAIAPAVARKNSRKLKQALDAELCVLMLHGALHLLGYDHETDNGEMDRREARSRARLGIA